MFLSVSDECQLTGGLQGLCEGWWRYPKTSFPRLVLFESYCMLSEDFYCMALEGFVAVAVFGIISLDVGGVWGIYSIAFQWRHAFYS